MNICKVLSAFALVVSFVGCSQQNANQTAPADLEWEWVKTPTAQSVAPGDAAIGTSECPAGKGPVSGGVVQEANPGSFMVLTSYPFEQLWRVEARNIAATAKNSSLVVWVLCAKGVPVAPN